MKPFHFIIILLVSPYLVGFAPSSDDSASTSISVGGGVGSYAEISRDCSGNVLSVRDIPFEEVAVSVDHYTPALHLNIGGGSIPSEAADEVFNMYASGARGYGQPAGYQARVLYGRSTIGVNLEAIGLDIGVIAPIRQDGYGGEAFSPIGTLRLGMSEKLHFRLRVMDDLPLLSGGPGLVNWGLSFPISEGGNRMFVGMGTVPYDGFVFGTQFEFPVNSWMRLELGGGIGGNETPQYGLSARTRLTL